MHVVVGVVDEPERRYRAGLKPQVFLHTLWRGERQLALVQAFLKVVYVEVAFAVENNKIVAVTFVVSEEEILAMFRTIFLPVLTCYLYCWSLGVSVPCMRYVIIVEVGENF